MTTVTVTPAQARLLAQRIETARAARAEADATLALLTLGHGLDDAVLTDVNTVTGVLTFARSTLDTVDTPMADTPMAEPEE